MLIPSKQIFNHIIENIITVYSKEEATSIARIILNDKFKCNNTMFLMNNNIEIHSRKDLIDIITRLKNKEPVQYILGKTYFCNIELEVNKHVLIPRQETEEMVMNIVATLPKKENITILDLCTGSGCIAVALKKMIPQADITAIDISPSALSVAKKNAKKNNTQIQFRNGNVLDDNLCSKLFKDNIKDIIENSNKEIYVPQKSFKTFDVIVSNPPYVRISEKENMAKNVLKYEPTEALFVQDEDPLIFYKKIKNIAQKILNHKGFVFVEINENLAEDIANVFKSQCEKVEIKKDLNNKKRWIVINKS